MIERAGALAKNEEIGLRVVVVITRYCCCGASCSWFRKCTRLFSDVSELALIVAQQALSRACYLEQIKIAIEIIVKEQHSAGWHIFDRRNRRIGQITGR